MKRALASFFAVGLVLAVSPGGYAECGDCVTALIPDTVAGIHPFFGIPTVTVHVDDDARDAAAAFASEEGPVPFSLNTIQGAFAQWQGECGGHGGLPEFVLDLETKLGPGRDERSTILINYEPNLSAEPSDVSDQADQNAKTTGSQITLFGLCVESLTNCDEANRFLWSTSRGQQLIAHEIGHALGLGHDKPSCPKKGLMANSFAAGSQYQFLPGYCELAGKLNDLSETCGLDGNALGGGIHPCEVCQYEVSGSVSGLSGGQNVGIHITGVGQP